MTFSLFGDKFTRHSGITLLMEDLNDGLRTPGAIMLGGGNPAQIPEMQDYFQTLLTDMLESGKATDALCNYDGPQGKTELLTLLAGMLREKLGWDIEPQNIALTNGSQSAFFYLFNLFAGRRADGRVKKVLFPLAPEYIEPRQPHGNSADAAGHAVRRQRVRTIGKDHREGGQLLMGEKITAVQRRLLEEVADLHGVPEGAYNIRANGHLASSGATPNAP